MVALNSSLCSAKCPTAAAAAAAVGSGDTSCYAYSVAYHSKVACKIEVSVCLDTVLENIAVY